MYINQPAYIAIKDIVLKKVESYKSEYCIYFNKKKLFNLFLIYLIISKEDFKEYQTNIQFSN